MPDPTEDQLDAADTFARELAAFVDALHVLHVENGSPSYRAIAAAAGTAGRVPLSSSAISEAFNGKRLPSLDFTLELIRQLAGSDQGLREQWRERWKRVKLHQRQAVAHRKRSQSLPRGLASSSQNGPSAAHLEAERIIKEAQAEAESIIESARIRADEMTESATQLLLNATESGNIPAAARLRLREHSRIFLAGPPGSGKGTQGPFLSKLLEVPHVHIGDLFRSNVAGRTKLGMKVMKHMRRGELVPDEVTLGMVAERLQDPDTQHGFLLDGLPRNLNQAEAVDDLLATTSGKVDAVLNVDISREESFRRLVGRRVCRNDSSHVAHIMYATPHKYGICDVCNGPLYLREDDTRHTIGARWDVWHAQTEPVVRKYGAEGVLIPISGIGTVSDITERAITALNAYFG
ncbi:nucleoside monophosphate kinase [Streptomyces antimycoticus]|uniref:nucleoside monophosphate kinase n=1 Tax=Streptomyces antimycoticus TaxID=68175 RepID=UPI003439B584